MKNALTWARIQRKRDGFERVFKSKFKATLDKQYKRLADRIDVTNYNSESILNAIDRADIEKTFIDLYTTVGVSFAKGTYRALKSASGDFDTKAKGEDRWYDEMTSYAKYKAGRKITSVTGETKKQALKLIREILQDAADDGLGADEVARMVKKKLLTDGVEINKWRALRIARTEIVTASNRGAMLGAIETGYPMEKEWIATWDSRTRDSHQGLDGKKADMDKPFITEDGVEIMFPGQCDDPAEVVNCRCTVGFNVKGM